MSSSSSATSVNRRVGVRNRCYCGQQCGLWTSWKPRNPGRRFLGCPNYRDKERYCGYLLWIDPVLPNKWYKDLILDLKNSYPHQNVEVEPCWSCLENQLGAALDNEDGAGVLDNVNCVGGLAVDVGGGLGCFKIGFSLLFVIVLVVVCRMLF